MTILVFQLDRPNSLDPAEKQDRAKEIRIRMEEFGIDGVPVDVDVDVDSGVLLIKNIADDFWYQARDVLVKLKIGKLRSGHA